MPASICAIRSNAPNVSRIASALRIAPSSALVQSFDAVLAPTRQLQTLAKPRQRRPQVVCDVAGHLLQSEHQILNAIQHSIQAGAEVIEFIIGAAQRHPLPQIPRHDRTARTADGLNSVKHAVTHRGATGERQHHGGGESKKTCANDNFAHFAKLRVADANEQIRAIRQDEAATAYAAGRYGAPAADASRRARVARASAPEAACCQPTPDGRRFAANRRCQASDPSDLR